MGVAQELSSPWDLEMGKVPGSTGESKDDVIYIAMAGTHQLWVHFLHDATWSKGRYGASQYFSVLSTPLFQFQWSRNWKQLSLSP